MSTTGYENMLEKYRDVDEDEIMSGLSKDELARLESEIDREILEKPPDLEEPYASDGYTTATTSSDDSDSDHADEEPPPREQQTKEPEEVSHEPAFVKGKPEAFAIGKLDKTQLRPVPKTLTRQKSKDKHTFKLPALKKTTGNKNPSGDGKADLKDELIQAVKKKDKRRTKRGNSSGVVMRRPSCGVSRTRRNSKVIRHRDGNEHQLDSFVNKNFVTSEMLNLRPKLRKVQIKEPKLVLPEELHGVSFNRITAGARRKNEEGELDEEDIDEMEPEPAISEDGNASRSSAFGYDADNDVTPSLSDESSALPGDDCETEPEKQGRKKAMSESSEAPSDGPLTMASTTSTSADSCDVFGELSINPNSVEEMIERVRDDDPMLTEVNLNNIHEVPIERFEELADAMQENTRVTSLLLANTGLTDRAAKALASMLKRNKTLKKLNIESNFITGDGARRVVSALRKNNSLTELSIDNQRHIFGAKVEMEMSKLLRENTSLLKFGYQFANPGPRMATSTILTKNIDLVRKKRVAEEKKRREAGGSKRPPLRRQPSSEWYRKERLDRLRKLQEQTKNLQYDANGKIKEGEVEKVLKNMNPDEVALLERWFTSKLLGMVDGPPVDKSNEPKEKKASPKMERIKQESKPKQSPEKPDDNLLRPPARAKRSKSPVASRDDLMDSIRKQSTKLKKVKLRPFESPSRLGNTDSDVEVRPLPKEKKTDPPPQNKDNSTDEKTKKLKDQAGTTGKSKVDSDIKTQQPDTKTQSKKPNPVDSSLKTETRGRQKALSEPKPAKIEPSNSSKQSYISSQREKAKSEEVKVKPTITKTKPSFDEGCEQINIRNRSPDLTAHKELTESSDNSELLSHKNDDEARLSSSSPEVREWKEGEEYDSDEYEVVEIEVTDSSEEPESGDNDKASGKIEDNKEKPPTPRDSTPSPSRDRCSRSPTGHYERFAHNRPPPLSASNSSDHPAILKRPDDTDKGNLGRSSSPRMRTASPISSHGSNPRTPISPRTPRSPPNQHLFGTPSYTRSLSRNSNSSTENAKSSPRFTRPTPPRSSRLNRSRPADDEEPICPKAMSTIESFFSFK
ncbi:uncharacterized protein LOC120340983 isoform X2 [Styela clava]